MSDTAPPPPARGLNLTRVDAGLATLRTMMINIGFFAAMVLLVPSLGAQLIRNPVVIEPIAVPEALADRGMTPTVAANRVWDGLQDFSRGAALARQSLVAVPDSQLIEFTLPGSSLSIDAVLTQLRGMLGIAETRIAGEIVCQSADCAPAGLRLRLRVLRGTAEIIDLPPMGTTAPDDYFREAAGAVYDALDPLVGAAARAVTDPEGATARALRIAASGGPDAAWAQALMGDIALAASDMDAAQSHYAAALAIDANLLQARLGLARSALAAGKLDAAASLLLQLPRAGELSFETHMLRADLALARSDLAMAEGAARDAAEADPLSSLAHIRLGQIALLDGREAEATVAFEEALAIDPGAAEAIKALGDMDRAEGKLDRIETRIHEWAAYAPDNADAVRALVAIRRERTDLAGAADAYAQLSRLGVLTLEEALDQSGILAQLNRRAEAGDVLAPFIEVDQPRPEAVLALARLHDAAGRASKALALYQFYVSLGADLPNIAEAKAAIDRLEN